MQSKQSRFTRFLGSQSSVQIGADAAVVMAACWIAFLLRYNFDIPSEVLPLVWRTSAIAAVCFFCGLALRRVYRQVWRFTGLPELRQLGAGVLLGALFMVAAIVMLRYSAVPRSVLVMHPVFALTLLGALRAGWRTLAERQRTLALQGTPLLIVGSLQESSNALRTLGVLGHWVPVGILSPVAAEMGRSIQNVTVLGAPENIARVASAAGVSTALMACPPGSQSRRDALLHSNGVGLTLLALPRPDEWMRPSAGPRRIDLEDLLGRDAVALDVEGLANLLSGRTVLVTGAGGSIGSELCRQIARFGVARLICVDISEFSVYRLEQELRDAHPQMQGVYYTANVREIDRLHAIARLHRPTVVFHAAAYKHVPLMESGNEIEALHTNVLGTLNAARVAGLVGASRFVLISTDKAVNPTNVMGASKRLAEQVMQALALEYRGTRFVAVRFGNVLGSSGSVVPLFTEQIASGGPLTVTHPDIVRYFMTIPEAAQLVLQAGLMGQSEQIFVLEMGEPVKILELAKIMIRLSGKTEHEIPIVFTGLRPGEKLYEELLANGETTEPTSHAKLHVAKIDVSGSIDPEALRQSIAALGVEPSASALRTWLQAHVPEYMPR
ncbi:polysaccharide biosynthesis protein [Acidovorax sp. LjRoot117]|uniref:polysaccharide biosynthesis protein n=1 Tax=Acidovorax sp. LjRoot117 TaxID=3342255 RepID=UPI003ECD0858